MMGTKLGHYRIVEKIGSGGMGEVYRATDTKLGREVAIKILPAAAASTSDRRARFEREARLLASLNHPNIAILHGFENERDVDFLVMELVPGSTLADRIEDGPIPIRDALPLFRQLAEALEAAHEKGVIHRDLKPANIKVTPEGKIKVLDFGLAKAFLDGLPRADLSQSPTFSRRESEAGVILGTAAYMSPEQARGQAVDGRTDIWSFGCVFYEALTGRKTFEGATVSDTIARILTETPNFSGLPAQTPRSIRSLLERCLEKDAARRLRHIDPISMDVEPEEPRAVPNSPGAFLPYVICALAAGVAAWLLKPAPIPPPPSVSRLVLPLDARLAGPKPSLAFSPDGRRLAYAAIRGETQQIYLRALDEREAMPISDTVGGEQPFFSPDGEWLGFFADAKLKKISLRGGSAIPLCETQSPLGGAWAPDDSIVFASRDAQGLSRVPAQGGECELITTPRESEFGHHWPAILPGGKAILFTVGFLAGTGSKPQAMVQSLETGERRLLLSGASYARYAPSGHIVYYRDGNVLAAPFDVSRFETTGPSLPIAEDLGMEWGNPQFAASSRGWLVYVGSGVAGEKRSLLWVDRKGTAEPIPAPAANYIDASLSPDGDVLDTTIQEEGTANLWRYDLRRDVFSRLTFEFGFNSLWSRDGTEMFFTSRSHDKSAISRMRADGTGPREELLTGVVGIAVDSLSPDGRFLVYFQVSRETDGDIWILPLEKDGQPRPFLRTRADEGGARFSPDGRFLAYVSNVSGRPEVFVQTFPEEEGKWQITSTGGAEPVWARDGKELFYRSGDQMMTVSLETVPTFKVGRPVALFSDPYVKSGWFPAIYDVSPDGQRFVMIQSSVEAEESTRLRVVENWPELLKPR